MPGMLCKQKSGDIRKIWCQTKPRKMARRPRPLRRDYDLDEDFFEDFFENFFDDTDDGDEDQVVLGRSAALQAQREGGWEGSSVTLASVRRQAHALKRQQELSVQNRAALAAACVVRRESEQQEVKSWEPQPPQAEQAPESS